MNDDARLASMDYRPLPPISRVQHAHGRALTYQLQYVVQSINPQ